MRRGLLFLAAFAAIGGGVNLERGDNWTAVFLWTVSLLLILLFNRERPA